MDDVPTVDMDAFEEFDDFEELEQGEIPEWQARREGKIQDREICLSLFFFSLLTLSLAFALLGV